jgi:hypothetical protein
MATESEERGDSGKWSVLGGALKKPPLVVIGVVLVLVAAIGAYPDKHLTIEPPWRITLAVLGALLLGSAVLIGWLGRSGDDTTLDGERYGVQITIPGQQPVTLNTDDDGRGCFFAEGTVKVLPKGLEIWVFMVAGDNGQAWPATERANVRDHHWQVKVRPGFGTDKKMRVYVVGKNGQAVIACYRAVAKGIWDAAKAFRARYPDSDLEFRTPGMPREAFASDMVPCGEVQFKILANAARMTV